LALGQRRKRANRISRLDNPIALYEMQKDLKIGMAVGLGLVAVTAIWLGTRPSLSTQARMQRLQGAEARNAAVPPPPAQQVKAEPPVARHEERPVSVPKPELSSRDSGLDTRATSTEPKTTSSPQPTPAPQTEQAKPIETEKFYIVQKGDTLSSIAHTYYGSAAKWRKIFNANHDVIPDANKLAIGAKLVIPD
jgi:nucleoid-associated protein YgaU